MKKVFYGKAIILSVFVAASVTLAPSWSNAATSPNHATQARLGLIKASHLASLRAEALKTNNGLTKKVHAGPAASWLRRVEPSSVNMVTNRLESETQDSISINGKKYYGSGDGYAATLLHNHSLTHATDPYTGARVDKAEAHIFVDASGHAHYFESADTYSAFISLAGSNEASLAE